MVEIIKYAELFLRGLGTNLLITALGSLGPLVIGVFLSFLASKNRIVSKVFGWLSLPFECISVPALLLVTYYFLDHAVWELLVKLGLEIAPSTIRWVLVTLIFAVSFAGYMPARHADEYSFIKNILYNGLGLVSSVFRWSFCVYLIGFTDLFGAARLVSSKTFNMIASYCVPLVAFFVVLFVLEAARRLIKQLMK